MTVLLAIASIYKKSHPFEYNIIFQFHGINILFYFMQWWENNLWTFIDDQCIFKKSTMFLLLEPEFRYQFILSVHANSAAITNLNFSFSFHVDRCTSPFRFFFSPLSCLLFALHLFSSLSISLPKPFICIERCKCLKSRHGYRCRWPFHGCYWHGK